MGTNALASLLKLVQARDSDSLKRFSERLFQKRQTKLDFPTALSAHAAALWGFQILGPTAKSALPDLIRLLDDDDIQVRSTAAAGIGSIGIPTREAVKPLINCLNFTAESGVSEIDIRELKTNSAFALGTMGSLAQEAIPELASIATSRNLSTMLAAPAAQVALIKIKGESVLPLIGDLTNFSKDDWIEKAWIVGQFGSNAVDAVPFLLVALNPTNRCAVLDRAAATIGEIGSHAAICVPALIPLLSSTNSGTRESALRAIRHFGTGARIAQPAIRALTLDSAWEVRNQATNALLEIDFATPRHATETIVPP